MKNTLFFILFILVKLNVWSQIGLPIQQSILSKNSLVVNYDFSKSSSFTRGSTTVSNISGSGSANLLGTPNFMNSLGFVSLNGTNQYLVTPNLRTYFKNVNSSIQKSFTMSLWVYPTSLNGVIISELEAQVPDPGTGFQYSNIEIVSGVIKYRVYSGTPVSSTQTLALNQWYHIAMIYDGTSLKGYLNGVLQGSQTYERTAPTSSQNYGIGTGDRTALGSGGYGAFNLAQFKLYHLPLSDSDILQEYKLRKDEFDYTIHSPSSNTNPTYWNVSSNWAGETTFSQDHYTPWLNNTRLGWAALYNDAYQWITLNYDEPAYIKGVVIQPRANSGNQFVTKVHVETSLTGAAPWTRVVSDIPVSTNITDDARLLLPTSVFAKSVKVIPVTWTNHITMRMGMLVKPNNPVTDGLVLNLDAANIKSYQGTGSIWSDLSSSSNHATISLSPTHNAATGLTFNGSTQYGRIPSVAGVTNFTNTQQYSIELWFNPANGQANNGEAELLEKWNFSNEGRYPFTIRFNEGGSSMLVACYDGGSFPYVTANGFSVNTWAQLVAVFNFVAKTLTVYRNGVSVGSTSLVGINQVSNSSPVGIAGRIPVGASTGVQVPFKGTIGIIRFYNKSLSANEVLQNFNTFKTRYGL
jgi:hypothetical protein